ncbi:MAG TPA: MFS transporter [Vicinamibacterales bacterium]|nr:MFS transporter [Vicinamibacterales bacterium]
MSSSSATVVTGAAASATGLTRNQRRGFMAAWGGWALDGMDASIYALVLVPALTELLPNSGVEVNQGSVGYYGSILQAMFLLGWGLSMVWGPISDRVGRVRALMLTILCYSLFTFLCGVVNNIWQLAVLRILVGIGIGGEQPVGAAYLAEELSESQRKIGAGLMHTGYYFGFFFASVANYFIGANYGWRWMFIFGGLPALLIGFIRYGVRESAKWEERFGKDEHKRPKMRDAFAKIFSPMYLRRTMVMSGLFLVSIIGLWAGSIYVPTAVTQVAVRTGSAAADAARLASYGGMLLAIGTIVGCVVAPFLAERYGRRPAMALYFAIMGVSIVVAFGYVFYLTTAALTWFYVCVFFLGFGGANFALYTLWLPELYSTDCRASAIGYVSSVGRFVGVAMVFILATGIRSYGSLGVPVAITAAAFLVGLVLLPLAEETRGKSLPA